MNTSHSAAVGGAKAQKALPGRRISLPGFGMGFFLAWNVSRVYIQSFFLYGPGTGMDVLVEMAAMFAAIMVTCAVFIGLQRAGGAFQRSWQLGLTVCISAVVGSILLSLHGVIPSCYDIDIIVASVLIGFSTAVYFLKWNCLYAAMPMRQVCVYYSGAFLLGGLIFVILLFLPQIASLIVACLLPIPATLCYGKTKHLVLEVSRGILEEGDRWTFPIRPTIVLSICTFTFFFLQALSDRTFTISWIGGGLLGLIGLVIGYFFYEVASRRFFNILALPVFSAAVLLWLLLGSQSTIPAGIVADFGYASFLILTGVILCNISYHYGANPVSLFAIIAMIMAAAHLLGTCIGFLSVSMWGLQSIVERAILSICLLLLILSDVAFFNAKDLLFDTMETTPKDSVESESVDNLSYVMSYYEALLWRCKKLALRYGLTHREEELITLLAQELSNSEIEEKLNLSKNTVKTHLRHIYAKTGIHSREELVELLDRVA